MSNHYDNLTAVADHYGLNAQLHKTLEELEELYIAIHSRTFSGEGGIYEEIADAYNMLDQIAYLTNHEEAIQDIAEQKMIRTLDRIKEEQ